MILACLIAAALPLISARWRIFVPVFAAALGVCLLSGYWCATYSGIDGLAGIVCFLVPFFGAVLALAGLAVAICRSVGQARNWRWGRMPHLLVSIVLAYGGAIGSVFVLLSL
ncbi:MAG: hypothetical protein AAGB15_08000 [Pseudomonadota bacterium]